MPNALTVRGGAGDMLKSVYDPNQDDKVDVIEAQISDLDHNAQKLKGVIINDAAKADQKLLAYDLASDRIVYITPAPSGAVIASIQRGVIDIPFDSLYANTIISSVDTTKSALRLLGLRAEESTPDIQLIRINLLNSTTVRAWTQAEGTTRSVGWEVVEYETGINSIQRGEITIDTDQTSVAFTVSSVDVNKTLLDCHGWLGADFLDTCLSHLYLLNSTTIVAWRHTPGSPTAVRFQLVEFE